MISSKPTLKEVLSSGNVAFGSWAQMDSPEAVEMIGSAGFDFAVIDMEHSHFGLDSVPGMIRAADALGISPVVRVMENSESLILKVLDMGAEGIVIPGVSTPDEARKAASAARYAPIGSRGACPTIRAAGHMPLDWGSYASKANEDVLLCLLVEGRQGAENFEDIVKVEGVDAVMIGPFDLSVSLGVGGQTKHPLVISKIEEMAGTAGKHGVTLACNVFDFEPSDIRREASRWIGLGARMVMLGGDKFFLMPALRRAIGAVKDIVKD